MRLFILCFALILGFTMPASAQRSDSIAAVVNGDIITYTDLYDRLNLMMKSSGMPNKDALKEKLLPQVLTGLITETIQLQEAKRLNIAVSQEEVEEGFTKIAATNNLEPNQFATILKQQKVNMDTLEQQIQAQIAWTKVVQSQIRPRVVLGDSDIEAEYQRLKDKEGQTEYSMAEIFLSYDDPSEKDETLATAKDLIKELSKNVQQFPAAARQFSQNASAASGGIIGWVTLDQMNPKIAAVVEDLEARKLSEPVAVDNGYMIIFIRDKRVINLSDMEDGGQNAIRIKAAHFPLPESQGERAAIRQQANLFARDVKGCLDIVKQAATDKTIRLEDLEGTEESLSSDIYQAVSDIDIGQAGEPIVKNNEVIVPMLCGRAGGTAQSGPSAAEMEIEQRMGMQRMDILQKRYLRDLISDSYIERRV